MRTTEVNLDITQVTGAAERNLNDLGIVTTDGQLVRIDVTTGMLTHDDLRRIYEVIEDTAYQVIIMAEKGQIVVELDIDCE